MTPLERRYRHLLALYPPAHRREYEDEMVTVLLADTAPGRDRPPVATLLDLLLGAATVRLRTTRRWLAGDDWRRAAPLAAKLVCLLLAARAVPVLGLAATAVGGPPGWRSALLTSTAGSLAWLVVAALSLAGWRAPATAVAGALTVAGAAGTLLDGGIAERLSISGWYLVVLGATATGAVVVRPSSVRPHRPLGVALGVAVAVTPGLVQLARRPLPFEWFWIAPIGIDPLSLTALGTAALGLVIGLVATRRLGFAVAARIAVLLVPGSAVRVLLGPAGQGHLLVDAVRPAWAAVAAGVAALVSFGLALIVLTAVERVVRLVLLGRAVEAERASGDAAEPVTDGRSAGSGRDGRS